MKQVAALERRIPTFGIEDGSIDDKNRRSDNRNVTEARLVQAVKLDVKIKYRNVMRKEATKYMRSTKNIGFSTEATSTAPKKEFVPASLETDVKIGCEPRAHTAESRTLSCVGMKPHHRSFHQVDQVGD